MYVWLGPRGGQEGEAHDLTLTLTRTLTFTRTLALALALALTLTALQAPLRRAQANI